MKSTRIYLRAIELTDALDYQKGTTIEEIRLMTGTPREYSVQEIEAHIKQIKQDESREDYAICLNETDEMIGELSILDIDNTNQSAVFRIAMNDTDYLGKGIGTEAIELVKKHVFTTLKLNRLQLEVFSHNLRAKKAYEKVGFIQEGVLREALCYKGKFYDEIIMSILKSDFESLNN